MSMFNRRPARFGAIIALLLALPLGGCALMGGGGKPQTMYAFGVSAEPVAPAPASLRPVTILYAGASFGRQSAGTRILTEDGNQVAYVAEARWVAPASELFDAAAIRRLEGISPSLRVVRIGSRPQADYLLTIEVRRFSAIYSGGPESAPDAVIEARAKLVRVADRTIIGDWPVEQREPAAENRVTAIVAALDRGTEAVATRIADLTRQATAAGSGI